MSQFQNTFHVTQVNVRLHAELPSCKRTFFGHPVSGGSKIEAFVIL